MRILAERQLSLSRKKSCSGKLEKGFHFLGIDYYSETRIQDNSRAVAVPEKEQTLTAAANKSAYDEPLLAASCSQLLPVASLRVRLHARTYRNAREQVKQRVADGFSATQIRCYLRRWLAWWMTALATSNCQP